MPNLVEVVAEHLGATPKKDGRTHRFGCPNCGTGENRFIVWNEGPNKQTGTFFCRQCRIAGDGIAYVMRFLGKSYPQACDLLGAEKKEKVSSYSTPPSKRAFPLVNLPSIAWQEQGLKRVKAFNRNLKTSLPGQALLAKRGITLETAERFLTGYNPTDTWESYEDWGMTPELKENGKERKVWLPKGLIIPRFDGGDGPLMGIKTRRENWQHGEKLPKYAEVIGSANCMGIFGDVSKKVAIIMESELDAVVVQQEAGDLCYCIALGGAGSKKIDIFTYHLLLTSRLVLLSPDYGDSAGEAELGWWEEILPKAIHWPTPASKSPGDAHLMGLNLHRWIQCAIDKYHARLPNDFV